MIANADILGNFTKEDIQTQYDNLKDNEHLLIILTDYREIYPIKVFKTDTLEFEYYVLCNVRPDSPAAKKERVEVVITRDDVEFRFQTNQVLGLKIKQKD